MNALLHSVAIALAKKDLPVPGGYNEKKPRDSQLIKSKYTYSIK
jgi:hypothetical protein